MAVCGWCNQEMQNGFSCEQRVEFPDGSILDAIPYHSDDEDLPPCHDCLTPVGGLHHPGCDGERCPKCNGQLIGCGCLTVYCVRCGDWEDNLRFGGTCAACLREPEPEPLGNVRCKDCGSAFSDVDGILDHYKRGLCGG